MITIKSPEEILLMQEAGQITARALQAALDIIKPGVSTADLNDAAHESILEQGASPAFLNYNGFPASLCVSINDEIVHGIPDRKRLLKEGDIVSLDCGAVYGGYVGDTADTSPVGRVSEAAASLITATRASFYAGLAFCREGARLHDISSAVQQCAESRGFSVVRDYVGHGIGRDMHEDPSIPNYGSPGKGVRLLRGMVLAIEPMINEGGWQAVLTGDGWTVKTADGSLSAHYEHTVAITDGDPLILTARAETMKWLAT